MSKTPRKDASDAGAPEVDTLEDEEFLTRWSRRKALSREGVELPEPVDEPADDSESPSADSASRIEDDRLVPAEREDAQAVEAPAAAPELPSIESLGEDSDYSAFMNAEVPADLQRKALRKLFQSPKFNVRDGLDDYDLDFSSPEPLGDIVTAEMRRRLRVELERLAGLGDDESVVEGGDQDAAPAPAKIAESEEQEPSADSEPDDDQPATA
jgi:hypothetical protein